MAEQNTGIAFGEQYDTQEFGLIDDGKYEVVIDKAEVRVSKTGKNYINFRFKIRDDVEQKFKRRVLFYSVTQKEGDACFDFTRINKMVLTQKGLPTYRDHFLEFDEVLQYLNGLHMVIAVETTYDDYSGADRNVVKDWSFEPSVWDKTTHSEPKQSRNLDSIDLPDSDLPF